MAKSGSCLLEGATFVQAWCHRDGMNTLNRHGADWVVLARGRHVCPRDVWRKQDERNTLNEHGTDGILLAQGLRKTDTTL